MRFSERELDNLCGAVIEACQPDDGHQYVALEELIYHQAYYPDEPHEELTYRAQQFTCEIDRFRIRRAVSDIRPYNAAARELARPLLTVLGFTQITSPKRQISSRSDVIL